MVSRQQNIPSLPPVSVIILTYNGSEFIKPLLDSLLNQSYPKDRMEILVVDNASSDLTLSIIRQYHPSVKIVALKKNIGFAAGNNQGFLHARHDLIVFLNQDTICHPAFLKSLVNVMLNDKTLAACNPNIVTPNPPAIDAIDLKSPPTSLYVCDLSPYGYGKNRKIYGKPVYHTKLLSGCAFIIRRQTISKLGYLFDDQLWMYAEDTDLSLRIYNTGQRICAARDPIVYHLHHTNMAFNKNRLRLASQAIMNRVYVFFKNMTGLEFIIFLPFLLIGGIFKIFEFSLPNSRKAIYFLPFGCFSVFCMIIALLRLPRFAAGRRLKMVYRRIPNLSLLKRMFDS